MIYNGIKIEYQIYSLLIISDIYIDLTQIKRFKSLFCVTPTIVNFSIYTSSIDINIYQ